MREALEHSFGLQRATSATILVVDDDARSQHVLTQVFERADHRVVRAANGNAVLSLVARHAPDVVVLEPSMPGVSGSPSCVACRSSDTTRCARAHPKRG